MNPLAPSPGTLRNADPRGRIDVAVYRLLEVIARKRLEPALKNKPVWDSGLGDFVEAAIVHANLPSKPISAADVFRELFGNPQRKRLR